jgi:hypothetical protein
MEHIGKQITEKCIHDQIFHKAVRNMEICDKGKRYIMELVLNGELSPYQCEACIIEWLCDDPAETCMNPDDTVQWWKQCPRSDQFWAKVVENAINDTGVWELVDYPEQWADFWRSVLEMAKVSKFRFKITVGG